MTTVRNKARANAQSGLLKIIVVVCMLTVAACTSTPAPCPPDTLAWTETRLFFGRDIGASGEVSAEQWRRFVIREITPRFSDGFTVFDAAGYWRGPGCEPADVSLSGGCEKTKVLLVQYEPDGDGDSSDGADAKLKAIADAYIIQFNQQAIMRSDAPVCTQFISRD